MGAYAEKRWHGAKGPIRYIFEVEGINLEIWYDTGNKETTYGKLLSARDFLEKEKWQKHVLEAYNKDTFMEIWEYVLNEQKKHDCTNSNTIFNENNTDLSNLKPLI